MKIGIDALGCNNGQSGAGSYLLNFIKNLPDKNECEFELFGLEIDRYTYTKNKEMPFVSVNIDENLKAIRRWHKHKLKAFCRKNKYDAVIFPAAHIVLPGKIKSKSIIILNGVYSVLGDKKEQSPLVYKTKGGLLICFKRNG